MLVPAPRTKKRAVADEIREMRALRGANGSAMI